MTDLDFALTALQKQCDDLAQGDGSSLIRQASGSGGGIKSQDGSAGKI